MISNCKLLSIVQSCQKRQNHFTTSCSFPLIWEKSSIQLGIFSLQNFNIHRNQLKSCARNQDYHFLLACNPAISLLFSMYSFPLSLISISWPLGSLHDSPIISSQEVAFEENFRIWGLSTEFTCAPHKDESSPSSRIVLNLNLYDSSDEWVWNSNQNRMVHQHSNIRL